MFLASSRLARAIVVAATIALGACSSARTATMPSPTPISPNRYTLVPAPRRLVAQPGELRLDRDTRIVLADTGSAIRTVAELLAVPLRSASGLPLPVVTTSVDAANAIVL